MRYFQLIDDLRIPGRWYLGDVKRCRGAALYDNLASAQEMPSVEISRRGRPLEFTMTSSDLPIIGAELATVISEIAGAEAEIQPIMVSNTPGYGILKARHTHDCVDQSRSVFSKLSCNDQHALRYRQVTRLYLDRERVPDNAHIFYVSDESGALIVSELLRDAMQSTGCFGAKFIEV